MSTRQELREGDRVLLRINGQLREAKIVRVDGPQARNKALVRFDDGAQDWVDTYVLQPAPREPETRERFWFPESQSGRRWLIALVVAVVGVIGTFLGVINATSRDSGDLDRATVPAVTSPSGGGRNGSPFRLRSSMLAYNAANGKHWIKKISADNEELLSFRIRATNLGSTATPNLVLDLGYNHAGTNGNTLMIAGFHTLGTTSVPARGPLVELEPYSAFGGFFPQVARLVDGDGGSPRALRPPLSGDSAQPLPNVTPVGTYELGVVEPHEVVTATITGKFATPEYSELSGGNRTIVFRHLSSSSAKYASTGAARRGDRLRFSVMLDNAGYRALDAHIRMEIRPRRPARFVKLVWLAATHGRREREMGRAIVNAEGRPILLSVIPGTTKLWSAESECSRQRVISRLPEGVLEGGLDVGPIGGFRVRDPCSGAQFTRFINFDVAVR